MPDPSTCESNRINTGIRRSQQAAPAGVINEHAAENPMLRTIKSVTECDISATDGPIGQVCGAFFDDEAWVVRYLVVETGSTRRPRSVLIPPIALGQPRWSERLLPVSMSTQQIMGSPDANTQKPVSREHVLNCLNYYAGLGYHES